MVVTCAPVCWFSVLLRALLWLGVLGCGALCLRGSPCDVVRVINCAVVMWPNLTRFAPYLLPYSRVMWLNAVGYSLLWCNVVNISYI